MKTQTTNHRYCPKAAVRYARVLYELNIPKENIEKTKEIFTQVPEIHAVFENPVIREEKKASIIDQIFPEKIRNFLKVVCRYHRINLIDDIFSAYEAYCDKQNQIFKAVLTCVEPPSEVQLKEMKAFLCKKYNARHVDVEIITDQSLLGGFVLSATGDEYDWSLKGRLKRLEEKLTWR